ncbi:MAG: type VI secretion system baseplate subunit TssF [Candidatus Parabeggiatoa sp.]|nr:type VI secretion system baseplate subunit TssF [Candidatus Parabeggiatoa sp.]
MTEQERLLHYYTQELAYLRKRGGIFATDYPKIAARLELSEEECPDPHIERLIEAVAFLTGRIQYNIESEFPTFTAALLDILYPHFLQPIPELTIAQFQVDPEQEQITTGHVIPKHTPLFTQTTQGITCRFRTCYPVTLWPLEISFADFETPARYSFLDNVPEVVSVLRLRFTGLGGISLQALQVDKLRVHINESWLEIGPLYELLFGHTLRIALISPGREHAPVILPPSALVPVGFDEEVLPYPPHAHPAYRLLQEYFAFSDKFLFFELLQLDRLVVQEEQSEFEVLFLFDVRPEKVMNIDKDSFRLGCTPIINLFSKISEPIRLTQRQTEYRLVPDVRLERFTEIHSILKVSASTDTDDESTNVQPFFSFQHEMTGKQHHAFWYARRVPTQRPDLSGTDMLLTFLDTDFNPHLPPLQTVFAHTLCSNRQLAEQIPPGAELQIEETAPLERIYCLKRPTVKLNPPLGGETVWRLISHLSVNHLSLTEGNSSLIALREILRLYNFATHDQSIERQIAGIRKMSTRQIVRRVGQDAWRGFVRGIEITLEFDKKLYVGSSPFLLGSVLERFFALYVSANSFTQLIIKDQLQDDIWKKWPPRAGRKVLL